MSRRSPRNLIRDSSSPSGRQFFELSPQFVFYRPRLSARVPELPWKLRLQEECREEQLVPFPRFEPACLNDDDVVACTELLPDLLPGPTRPEFLDWTPEHVRCDARERRSDWSGR